MLLERSGILDSAHAKPTVSGMRRIKSTSFNFRKRKPFFGSSHSFGREIDILAMFSKTSALSSDETVESARPRYRSFDQQRARVFKEERMLQTYPALNKKKCNTFILVCMLNQNHRSLSGKSWAELHDVGFFTLETVSNFWKSFDTVETRLSHVGKWNYMVYDTGNSDVRTVMTSDGGIAIPRYR